MEKETVIQTYVESPTKQQQLYKRTLVIVVISQILGGAGLAAGVTVGALLAKEMFGGEGLAGIPAAIFTLGSAGAALLVGRLSQRYGRRIGLATGFLLGGVGAIGVIIASIYSSIGLLLFALLIYGSGTATNLQARYAGTDLANAKQRATAVSIAMVSTTFGAVAGPNLVGPMGRFAESIQIPTLAGPFILAAVAFILAGLVLAFFLTPDPLLVAKAVTANELKKPRHSSQTAITPTTNPRGIVVGATIMILTQLVMVGIMTMTPIHMQHHGHEMGAIGLVIGLHIGAMYLPSLVTGILVDKIGRTTMAIAAGATLLLAGLVAAYAPGESTGWLIVALMLLGLGWNFGLISGTALIIDATNPLTRAKTQGSVDVWIALAGASGGALSGIIMALSSFSWLSLIGGFLSLLLVPVVIWASMKKRV